MKERKRPMTAEEYVAHGTETCPFCESTSIEGNAVTIVKGGALQEVLCNSCGKEWTDVYHLAGYDKHRMKKHLQQHAVLAEQVRLAREGLEKALDGLESAAGYFDKEDDPGTVRSVYKALKATRRALRKTKPKKGK